MRSRRGRLRAGRCDNRPDRGFPAAGATLTDAGPEYVHGPRFPGKPPDPSAPVVAISNDRATLPTGFDDARGCYGAGMSARPGDAADPASVPPGAGPEPTGRGNASSMSWSCSPSSTRPAPGGSRCGTAWRVTQTGPTTVTGSPAAGGKPVCRVADSGERNVLIPPRCRRAVCVATRHRTRATRPAKDMLICLLVGKGAADRRPG